MATTDVKKTAQKAAPKKPVNEKKIVKIAPVPGNQFSKFLTKGGFFMWKLRKGGKEFESKTALMKALGFKTVIRRGNAETKNQAGTAYPVTIWEGAK